MSRQAKQRRSAESRRRAATSLAQLAWLAGYPAGDGWRTLAGESVVIDGARIASARRTARTALREHADALAELVGDVDRWWAVVDAVLAWCSAPAGQLDLLAHAPPRTARAARALRATHPALGAVIDAASVAWALAPDELARVIAWLAAHPGVEELAVETALQLARLAGAGEVEPLLSLLALDAPDPVPARERIQSLANQVRHMRGAVVVPKRSWPQVVAWIGMLARFEPVVQRRALALLEVADLASALRPWQAWERTFADRVTRAVAFVDHSADHRDDANHRARIAKGLEAALAAAPPVFAIADGLDEVAMLAIAPALAAFHAAIVRLLGAWPPAAPGERARLLLHVARIAATAEHRRPAWLWEAVAAALEAGADPRILGPWRAAIARARRSWLDDDLVHPLTRRGEVDRLVGALAALATRGDVAERAAEQAAIWIGAGLAEAWVPELVARLADGPRLTRPLARAAVVLAAPTPAALAHDAAALFAIVERVGHHEATAVLAFVDHAARTGASWLVRAIAASHGAVLAEVAVLLAVVHASRWPAIATPRPSPWVARYPAALAPALARLASVDPDAEATARKQLARDLPDPAALRQEIAALRARLADAPRPVRARRSGDALAARLANLEARLARPRLPSAARIARLAAKLEHAACTGALARLGATARAEATARIVRAFGLSGWPGWPLDRRTIHLLLALIRLDTPERELAGRLLRARAGPRPWDLRDDPANRAFLDRVRAGGLAIEPWLDPTPVAVTAGGQLLELALCDDPLEVFAMGAHFETCLAPDGGNFFSVIANAADINKRVLYARRDGRVVGRCLFAITDAGGLLAFNPYCHEAIKFHYFARDFAIALAERMRTVVVPRGAVSTILARSWYDDGPRDLVGRFAALRDAELAEVAPDALVATLTRLLADPARPALAPGTAIDDITLPIVLALPGIERRPELIVPLAPFVLATSVPATRATAAALALDADQPALADRLLGDHGEALARALRFDGHVWTEGRVLARLRPVRMLARVRETRGTGSRDDTGERLGLAGLALETLHRPRQALAMYRGAIEREPGLRGELAPRIAALEARIPRGR